MGGGGVTRCRRTDVHRCTLGRHTDRPAQPSLLPPVVALALAFAALFASGAVRA